MALNERNDKNFRKYLKMYKTHATKSQRNAVGRMTWPARRLACIAARRVLNAVSSRGNASRHHRAGIALHGVLFWQKNQPS